VICSISILLKNVDSLFPNFIMALGKLLFLFVEHKLGAKLERLK
jgi:hypothetical protein